MCGAVAIEAGFKASKFEANAAYTSDSIVRIPKRNLIEPMTSIVKRNAFR